MYSLRTKFKNTVQQFDSPFKTLHTQGLGGSIHSEMILNMQDTHAVFFGYVH